jgi:hypothetical protein
VPRTDLTSWGLDAALEVNRASLRCLCPKGVAEGEARPV